MPDSLLSPLNHREYSLWDATTFYEHRVLLPERMQQSIHWYLYQNMKESDAALRMGIAETNPVGTYATIGLTSLLAQAVRGELTGYLVELEGEVHASV